MSRPVPTSPSTTPAPRPGAADPKPADLEERIERLEKRLDETIGDTGKPIHPPQRTETELDRSEMDDPLRRAVTRANGKRSEP